MPSRRKPPPSTQSSIPAELRAAAAVYQEAQEANRRAFRERVEKDELCQDAVKAFRHATHNLWTAPLDQAGSLLPTLYEALVKAAKALEEVGRLDGWERIDHVQTYDSFKIRNGRSMSRPSYDWARELLNSARAGVLDLTQLTETWQTEGLQDAVRWLSIFIEGLSGEGAVLPQIQKPTTTAVEHPIVYYLGDRSYRVGDSKPVSVHDNYDCLLRAFIDRPVLDLPALVERSGLDRDRILGVMGRFKKIYKGLFADTIECPGIGGKGQGYRATVVDFRPNKKC